MTAHIPSDRPPRIQPELPVGTVEIPKPPDQRAITTSRLVQVALPLTTIIGYILISAFGGSGRSPLLLIPMALSVVASTAFAIYTYRREEVARAAEREAYAARLLELYRDMRAAHEAQRRFARYNYPDPGGTLAIVRHAQAVATNPADVATDVVRLWERRIGDADFGLVRLGLATLPSTVVYTLREAEGDSPLHRDARKLAADSQYVGALPATLLLRPPPPPPEDDQEREAPPKPPFCHALAIAGETAPAADVTRALIAQLATFHAPSDLRLMLLADRRADWAWVSRLPHAASAEHGPAVLFLDEAGHSTNDDPDQGRPLERWAEGLRRTLAQRKLRLQDPDQQAADDPTLPQLVVVIDLLTAADNPAHPLHSFAATDAGLGILLAEGALLGAAVLFLVPRRSKAPGGCTAIVEVERTAEQTVLRYAAVGLNSLRLLGDADTLAADHAEELATTLAGLKLQQTEGSGLAKSVSFLELISAPAAGEPTIESLAQQALAAWSASLEQSRAAWLRARIGLMAGNKERTLVFSANRDGVHGLVAGSTGSGKSELLIALIAGMAVSYSPQMLNFVLVDFKGGGAFEPFQKLPHVVDIVTNLNGDAVTRMFTAIRAELDRRQRLNTNHRVNTIVEYHQRGYHIQQPYPFLFIVIDEFAEMIAERAEAKAQLEQITRIGRSLGVHLLLAAQRPSGVTDQMRSNIKYRICLRVESQGESREMLRRTEAAYLPNNLPGRGYLQVGNEEIELIQVAYAGELYVPPGRRNRAPVRWKRHQGGAPAAVDTPPRPVFLEVIDALYTLAAATNVPQQQAPWPGPLPTTLTLTDPLTEPRTPDTAPITAAVFLERQDLLTLGHEPDSTLSLNPALARWIAEDADWPQPLDWQRYALRPVIGLVDAPAAARQYPLTINLTHGHVVIYGAPGSGKTGAVRTLVGSLAATHAPDQVHIYLLDLGGRALLPLAKLPHVGAVITPNEAEASYRERIEQLLRELADLVERRKTILGDARADTLPAYNAANPYAALPAVVLAIDNFSEFVETFGRPVEGGESGLERLVALARQSRPYGVHLLITAGQPMQIPNQLANFLTERIALRLADPGHYRDAVGVTGVEPVDLPGRGYAQIDQSAPAVQIATIDSGAIERLIARQQVAVAAWPAGRREHLPQAIEALPTAVLLRSIMARAEGCSDAELRADLADLIARQWAQSREPEHAAWLVAPLGVTAGNKTRTLQLQATLDGVHGMVAGGTGAGKSELLMSLIVSLALRYDPSVLNFVLVDYKGGGAFEPFRDLPHVVDLVTNLNQSAVRRMFTAIGAEMDRRSRILNQAQVKDIVEYRAKGLHLNSDPNAAGPLPHLFIIIDEYAEMISASPEFRDELDRITRIGRSLGLNLLLAAQRPVGVSDQMRANMKLRICLRVEGVETSREMLRRPDAAFLPNGMPGRGYVQVGNEQIELIQVAYTGEPVPDRPLTDRGEPPRFFEVVVQTAAHLLHENGVARPRAPWPPALPPILSFDPHDPQALPFAEQAHFARRAEDGISLAPELAAWLNGNGAWPQPCWGVNTLQPVVGLLDDPYNARQLPLTVNLNRGHALIFGSSGSGKTSMLRMLALSLAATHGPKALNMHLLDLGGRSLQLLAALPQVGTVIVPDDGGYEEQVQLLWRELNAALSERKLRFGATGAQNLNEYNARFPTAPLPAIVLMIDTVAEFIDAFTGRGRDEDDAENPLEQLITLARQGKNYGLHIVMTANRLNNLSSKLYSLFAERLALHLTDADEYVAIVGNKVEALDEHPGRGAAQVERRTLQFQVALLPPGPEAEQDEKSRIEAIGRHMHTAAKQVHYAKPVQLSALPERVPYREVLARHFAISPDEAAFAEQLAAAVAASWQHQAASPEWPRVPLGVASGNQDRTLTLAAQHDGVHGMVAGGTGSGKSELLMTFIIGLALTYPPSVLNFVLVDYKGGGAFKPFESLPHCVEIVTNLNTSAVERMFSAISAEIRRRQQRNADTGTKDIVDYRKRGLQQQQPYPHLVIIIDEYAEMIDSNPDYRLQLESITRVGRAQGVHLLLASQRPKGVTDQMRANIKLRLCLKVEDADTSRELLRRPDAARLPNGLPGRGFLQGGGERIEMVQVAYCGDPVRLRPDTPVRWPQRANGEAIEEELQLFNYAVTVARAVHADAPVRRPWPAMLPTAFSLETPLPDWERQAERATYALCPALSDWIGGDTETLWPGVDWKTTAMRATIGLIDDPEQARQQPLTLDLNRNHLAVFGDGGSGKTTLLRTVVATLAATHRPDELHVYVIDMAGHNFRSLEPFPQVGAILSADEELFDERLRRLLDYLSRTADERQQRLARADTPTIADYNAANPTHPLPAILVLLDNIAALQESYGNLLETSLIPLVRRALGVGITFVVAGNAPNSMSSRLYGLFAERLTFRQSNTDRYMDIVGRGAVELDNLPGRGYIRAEGRTLLIHAAQSVGIYSAEGRPLRAELTDLRFIGERMREAAHTRAIESRPYPIDTLRSTIDLAELIDAAAAHPARIPLGVGGDLEPAWIDLRRSGPHFTIVGPPLSGKTTALRTWALSLAERFTPDEVTLALIDPQSRLFDYGGALSLRNLPHVDQVISEPDQFAALTDWLETACTQLAEHGRPLVVLIDNFDEFSEELEKNSACAKRMAYLARRYGRDGLHIVIAAGLDANNTEIRRRIQVSRYGLGLRTADALGPLKVLRNPAGLEGRELPLGRGYLVKAGQTNLVQIATPHPLNPAEDEEQQIAAALDGWVARIAARHPPRRVSLPAAAPDPKTLRLQDSLQRAAQILHRSGVPASVALAAQIEALDAATWNNHTTLLTLIPDVLRRLDPYLTEDLIGSFDEESLIRQLASKLDQ